MPATQQQPKPFDTERAERFAALVAGIDLGNPNDAEAAGKLRAMRRMAAESGMRVVDVLELPLVRKAIDDQMQPDRKDGPALQNAMEQVAALREELTARTRDVRSLAELVTQRDEAIETLRAELVVVRRAESLSQRRRGRAVAPPAPLMGKWWLVQVVGFVAMLALLVVAVVVGVFRGLFD
jgi:hypothetical protein